LSRLLLPTPIAFTTLLLILPVAYVIGTLVVNVGSGLAYVYVKIPPDGELYRVYHVGGTRVVALTGYDFGPVANTFILASIVSIVSTGLALVTAVTCLSLRGPSRLLLGYIAPLVASIPAPLISAYAVIHLFHRDFGLINVVLGELLGFKISLEGIAGVAVYQILNFYPIAHLIILSYMELIDRRVVEVAYNLGGRGLGVVSRIVVPLAKPAILVSLSLVFILSADDLSGPIAFSRYNSARNVMAYIAYYDFISELGYTVSVRAVTYIAILTVTAVVVFLIAWRHLKSYLYPVASPTRIHLDLGLLKIPLLTATLVLTSLAVLPTLLVVGYSLTEGWFGSRTPLGVTVDNYLRVVSNQYYARALANTVAYTVIAVVIAAIIAHMAAYSSLRSNSRLSPLVEVLTVIPIVVPGIAVGIGYFHLFHSLFKSVPPLDPMVNPSLYLVLAYASRRLTYTSRPIIASLQKIPLSLEEQALNLGARALRVIRTIILPLTLNPMLVGVLLTALHVSTEFSVSVVLAGAYGVSASHPAPITPVILGALTYNPLSIHVMSALLIATLVASITASVAVMLVASAIVSGLGLKGVLVLARGVRV
jgi:ABC-type Fe3+ transport system permease subunit